MTTPAPLAWYFDVISPYAYFAFLRLPELPAGTPLALTPVLFAGLLNHWGQKGPAEIAPKRIWTYRSCAWYAASRGIPFRMPAAHPFNPLPYLRLVIAAGSTRAAVGAAFETIWASGADPADPATVAALAERLGLPPAAGDADAVKQQLRANTEAACAAGVFGVPTLMVAGEPFWGVDGLDFALAVLREPSLLASPDMQRIGTLPMAAVRRA